MYLKKAYPVWLTVVPFSIYLVFLLLPTTVGFSLAFTNWNPYVDTIRFTGFDKFRDIFGGRAFSLAIFNTLHFAFYTSVLKTLLGLALALALNTAIRSRNVLRTVFFFPVVLSPLVVGLLFSALFDTKDGMVNHLLAAIDIGAVPWLGMAKTARIVFVAAETWRSAGYAMVLCLAAMQSIPSDYYEAATLDGAGAVKKFFAITLPFTMPAINLNILMSMLFGLKIFDLIYILTGGGPGGQTETLSTLIMNQFSQDLYAEATATNLAVFLILVTFAFVFQFYQKKTEVDV